MSKISQSIFLSSTTKYILLFINLASVVLYSRLLTPEEIGVHVVAVAVAALATEVRLLGTGGYLIKQDKVSKLDTQLVSGVTMIISYPLGIVLILLSPSIEAFYEVEGISEVLMILSLGFFIAPFIAVSRSILSREFKFKILMFANVTTSVATFVITLSAIWLEFSYLSLAIGLMTGQYLRLIIFYFVKPENVSWRPRLKGAKQVFRFGIFVAQASLLRKLSDTAPELIIGKLGGATMAAYFSRGLGLLNFAFDLVKSAVQPVVMPYLSEAKRAGGSESTAYLNAVSHLSVVLLPLLAVLSLSGYSAITLMFGDQWVESVAVVPALCLYGGIRTLYTWSDTLLITKGLEKINFYRQIISATLTISLCWLGFSFGFVFVGYGLAAAAFVDFCVVALTLKKHCAIPLHAFFNAHLKSLICASVCWLFAYAFNMMWVFEEQNSFVVFLALAVSTPIVWLTSIFIVNHKITSLLKYYYVKVIKP